MNKNKTKSISNLTVEKTSQVSDELMELLNNTVLGTPGKLRYKHTELEQTLRTIENLEFIQIKKGNRVLGTAGIVQREVNSEPGIHALYVRYLSVFNPFKNRTKTNIKSKKNKPNTLRESILKIFTNELESAFKKNDSSGIYYAFVEKENILSRNLCESFGFSTSREISTFLFSRFDPKLTSSVKTIDEKQLSDFKSEVETFYKNHSLFFNDSAEKKGTLYGYYSDGELIAGLRAFPVKWKLVEVPGFSGFLMTNILPQLPFFKRLFNSDTFEFLAFDHIWFKPNQIETVQKLMEAACSEHNIHIGMSWQDSESKLAKYFRNQCKLGLLHKINGEVKADLMIRKINISELELEKVLGNPIFISAIDMT